MTKGSTWGQRGKSAEVRFSEKFSKGPGCWIWHSAVNHRGYGAFYVSKDRKIVFAHRYALEQFLGRPIAAGMLVMHSCDNPTCVNPAHLSEGTNRDNQIDASIKGRNAHGERNGGGGRLTTEQASAIKHAAQGGKHLAEKYGVTYQTVKAIRRGQIWKSAP